MIGDEAAVSSIVDFVVAMGVFVILLGLFFTFSPLSASPDAGSSGQATAQALVDALVDRPGLGEGVGTRWDQAPENLSVLGLRDGGADRLAFGKIVALAHGNRTADPANGAVDYPDARRGLGLDRFVVDHALRIQIRPDPGGDETVWRTDRLDEVPVAYLGDPGTETGMIDETAVVFDPGTPTEPGPDVYDDTQTGVDELVVELPRYQVLVVGSGADHAPLDRPNVRSKLATWVDTGGGLVVLGSGSASGAWLDGILDEPTLIPGTGPIVEVNASTNLGTIPYDLRVRDYQPTRSDGVANDTWTTGTPTTRLAVDAEGPSRFTLGHALAGNGSVTLTTYRPTAIAGSIGQEEARRLVANLVATAATGPVNLDYGPAPIQTSDAWTADRDSTVDHPRIGSVRVRVSVTLWGG